MNKYKFFILLFLASIPSFSQFDDDVSKAQLFDMASDMRVYGYTLVKDKLFLINNLMKKDAAQEFDYAMSKIEESLSTIDMDEDNANIKKRLKAVKEFWYKFNQNVTKNMNNKDFRAVSFDINNWNRLTSDLLEAMKANYDLPLDKMSVYFDTQDFRVLLQKITTSYLANYLSLSKSFMHAYQKNISDADNFIKNKSNKLLNNPVSSRLMTEVIVDWGFMRENLTNKKQRNPKTIFMLSISSDYHLRELKTRYLQQFIDKF